MYTYKIYHRPLSFISLLFIVFKVYYSRLLEYLSIVEQSLHETHAAVMVWKCVNELRWTHYMSHVQSCKACLNVSIVVSIVV